MIYGIQTLDGRVELKKFLSVPAGRDWRDGDCFNMKSHRFERLPGKRELMKSPKGWRFPIEKGLSVFEAVRLVRKVCAPINPCQLRSLVGAPR